MYVKQSFLFCVVKELHLTRRKLFVDVKRWRNLLNIILLYIYLCTRTRHVDLRSRTYFNCTVFVFITINSSLVYIHLFHLLYKLSFGVMFLITLQSICLMVKCIVAFLKCSLKRTNIVSLLIGMNSKRLYLKERKILCVQDSFYKEKLFRFEFVPLIDQNVSLFASQNFKFIFSIS